MTEATELSLRERKAAQTRLALARALQAHLATRELEEISVDEIAADANVSRMTFFNYFPTKRDAVDLLRLIYALDFEAAIRRRGLRGVDAIDLVFTMTGEELAEAPDRLRRVWGAWCGRPPSETLPELSRADRMELLGDHDVPALSMGHLFIRLVQEAREDGLEVQGSDYEVAHFIGSLLNGATLTGHSSLDTDWKQLFRRHARRALGLLGAEGWRDPRAPRTPKRYR